MTFPEGHTWVLPDGRRLAWCEYGPPTGFPVLYFHGTPGSRWQVPQIPHAFETADVRLIAFDRPGFGGSSPLPSPRPLSGAEADVSALLEHLGIDAFSCVGVSGGAAFAAAIAQELPGRVRRLVLVCPVGNPRAPGALESMGWMNRLLFCFLLDLH